VQWPTLSDQITAVLNAPIPFLLVIAAIGGSIWVAIWRAMEWCYRTRLDKWAEVHALVKEEVDFAKNKQTQLGARHEKCEVNDRVCDRNAC
jgi:hypothetical protein